MRTMLLGLCLVAIVIEEAIGQDKLIEYQEAGYLSRLEFKNAEVMINCWRISTPEDPNISDLTFEQHLNIHAIVDYENERCFWLQKSELSSDSGRKNNSEISFVSYRDGRGVSSPSTYTQVGIDQSEFFEYLGRHEVWRVEMAGTGGEDRSSTLKPESLSDSFIRLIKNANVQQVGKSKFSKKELGDGTVLFVTEWGSGIPRFVATYSPKFVFPTRVAHTILKDGKEKVDYQLDAKFDLVDGFTRGRSVNKENATSLQDQKGNEVPALEVTTIQYKWLQFNAENLEWPDEKKIMSSNKKMIEYLTPED